MIPWTSFLCQRDHTMYICLCRGITCQQIEAAAQNGARSNRDLNHFVGSPPDCGQCGTSAGPCSRCSCCSARMSCCRTRWGTRGWSGSESLSEADFLAEGRNKVFIQLTRRVKMKNRWNEESIFGLFDFPVLPDTKLISVAFEDYRQRLELKCLYIF